MGWPAHLKKLSGGEPRLARAIMRTLSRNAGTREIRNGIDMSVELFFLPISTRAGDPHRTLGPSDRCRALFHPQRTAGTTKALVMLRSLYYALLRKISSRQDGTCQAASLSFN